LSRSCSCGCVRRKTTKSASGLRSWSTDLVAAAATDVIKIRPLFFVFSHVCEWKRKSEKRGRKRRRTSARTRRYVRQWTFETDRRKKRIIFFCFFVFLFFFLDSFLFGLRDIMPSCLLCFFAADRYRLLISFLRRGFGLDNSVVCPVSGMSGPWTILL
jgi:hypothetical protein